MYHINQGLDTYTDFIFHDLLNVSITVFFYQHYSTDAIQLDTYRLFLTMIALKEGVVLPYTKMSSEPSETCVIIYGQDSKHCNKTLSSNSEGIKNVPRFLKTATQ